LLFQSNRSTWDIAHFLKNKHAITFIVAYEKLHFMTTHLITSSVLTLSLAVSAFAQDTIPPLAKPGDNGYISGRLIYELEGRQTPQCHASTIVETPSGLVAAWFGGKHEKNVDVGIWVSRHSKGSWSKPVEVVNGTENEEQDFPCWNPVLFQPKAGPLMLFYKVGPSPSQWWGALVTSQDGGKTWSESQRLGTSDRLFAKNRNLLGPVKNKPVQLADGAILCPSSTENEGWRIHFEITRDLGKTFEVIGPLDKDGEFDAIQPSILQYADGRMQIMCRTKQSVVAQSWSSDGGKTWSHLTASPLPNPNSGTDAVTLADGRQLIVYNHTVRGGEFPSGRNMLNVALSTDGKSWTPALTLERDKGEYSYPAVIQAKDGTIHIAYTWRRQSVKHVAIDPKRLRRAG
jgi:predicted neuraminidase